MRKLIYPVNAICAHDVKTSIEIYLNKQQSLFQALQREHNENFMDGAKL